jgi:hypothetical protein
MKRLYITKETQDNYWHYVGDPLNPFTTLDVGLVKIEDKSEIKVDDYGAYVERELSTKK